MLFDQVRQEVVSKALATRTVQDCWPTWQRAWRSKDPTLEGQPQVDNLLDLADSLAEVFRSTRGANGRSQASLAGGGHAWESLVLWYLNLCLIGSRSVVLKLKADWPEPIKEAMTVSYGNHQTNTESDLLAITFRDDRTELPIVQPRALRRYFSEFCRSNFRSLAVTVIQCKTNWNDSAQIPMLWDMVYQAQGFRGHRITVGKNNFQPSTLADFTYAFATVPTTRVESINPNSMPVLRVRGLSGGNYWGRPTASGIALSLKELFNKARVGPSEGSKVRETLHTYLPRLHSRYAYFNV